MSDFDLPLPDDERERVLAWLFDDDVDRRMLRRMAEVYGIGPGVFELPDLPLDQRDPALTRRILAEAVEDIRAGETVVIDLGLGLAARPFDAERRT